MNVWRPIDAIGNWLKDSLGAEAQLRFGVLCVLWSLPLMVLGFFVDEPFLIYQMSATALLLTGIGIVISAQVLVKEEEKEQKS